MGSTTDSRSLFSRITRRSRSSRAGSDHLGQAFSAVEEHEKAADAWTRALALDPKNAAIKKKRDDAAAQIKTDPNPRRTLKRIEGNFRQVMNGRSGLAINGKWQKKSVKARGRLYFLRPRHLVFEMNGWGSVPGARLLLEEDRLRVEPATHAQAMPPLSQESLQLLAELFSGELVASFDRPEVQVKRSDGRITFSEANGRFLAVSAGDGLPVEINQPNASGGIDAVTIPEYALEDGLWVPKQIRWKNAGQAWSATLTFSDWMLNDPANEQVLSVRPQ